MASLNITEFRCMTIDENGATVPVGQLPAVGSQNVTFTTSSQSSALDRSTRFVRLISDATAYVTVGEDPTATASSTELASGVEYYFGIQPGNTTWKIAAYDGSS